MDPQQQIMNGAAPAPAEIGEMALSSNAMSSYVKPHTEFLSKNAADPASTAGMLANPLVWYAIVALIAFVLFCMVRYTSYRYAQAQKKEQNAAFQYGVPTRESWMDLSEEDLADEYLTDDESMAFDAKSRRSI